ncbi:MAG: PorT family protein, partial [Muribaculaceae bacterium]|nr:PorT family protein [Muribaculaceae bacterium]
EIIQSSDATTNSLPSKTNHSAERLDTGATPYCTAEERQHTTTTRPDTTGYHEADQPSWHTPTVKPLTIKTKNSHQLALSVYTSGTFASNTKNSGQIDNFAPLRSMVIDDEILSNQPLVISRSVNSIDTRNFDMRHHLPLRAGFKVSYQIFNNIAIESGVQYSRHTSDFSYDSNFISATGEQELHYIGIPLDINIGLARWKRLRAYATAGVSTEKLIKGNLKGQITERDGNMTSKREQLTEKPLQWTLNATAGLQYDLTDQLGLYAEPGLGYHPDNKSSLRNIYKDRPVDFTLTIGLRLTLHR